MLATREKATFGRRAGRAIQKHWELYLLILPVIVWYIIFCYIPMGGVAMAFKNFKVLKGFFASDWVGFANFERFLSSPAFFETLRNTVIISFMNLVFVFPAPILFAILLNEIQHVGPKRFVQTVSYLPHFISWTIAGGLFYMLLSPSNGAVNGIIKAFGGAPVNFFAESRFFRWILVISSIWKSLGWSAIVYLAAVAGVDEEMYDAAKIDGAGRFQRIWSITLPSISNVIVIMLILQVGSILNVNFEQVFVLINDSVLSVGETIEYYIYRIGLFSTNNYSLGATVGLFKSVVGLALILITNKLSKRISEDGGIW